MQYKPCTTTRIKARNFYNRNFLFHIYVLLTENLNPFSLERKITDKNKYEMIYMVCKECILTELYRFICQEENFLYLNGKNLLYPKTSDMVWSFISQDNKNYN